ncbi:hypothetical protein ACL598_16945 [Bordetella bronchialis]|uniref:hypothetical protein n=1 Tax=Bordetella bronchialis TaxID=463025 RepID=UPI003D02E6CC
MTENLTASVKDVDMAIGFTHGVRAVLSELVGFVTNDDPKKIELFAARLDRASDGLDPSINAYASAIALVLGDVASDLRATPEQKQALATAVRSIRAKSE